MGIIDRWVDRWRFWRTGLTREERDYRQWCDQMINSRACRVQDIFRNFKHIVAVNPDKFLDPREPFAWVPCANARTYFWPQRPLGQNCVWTVEQVMRSPSTANQWERTSLGGETVVFVATNSERDAVMIALKWS